MTLATGAFQGRSGHTMRGTYSVRLVSGKQVFETSDDFFFDGAPEPGFAISASGVLDHATAVDTDFLRLAPSVSSEGVFTAPLPDGVDITEQTTVFLWCYLARALLGEAPVES
ncbi:MAG: hypothetical protein AAGD04_10550 [Pseudomonadota bacterium]